MQDLIDQPLVVINVGLSQFVSQIKHSGNAVISTDWRPPANGDPNLAALLTKLGS